MSAHIDIGRPNGVDLDKIHAFLKESYWSPGISRELVARACAHSICAMARDEESALIGFARVVSDCATFAWLCDVFVLPSHQKRGIARALVRALMQRNELKGLRRWLLATRDAHGVYAPLGFQPLTAPERWMEIASSARYGRVCT